MKRRLLDLMTALSLLLCVAVGVLWVRSHVVADDLTWQGYRGGGEFRGVGVGSRGGGVKLSFYSALFDDARALAHAKAAVEREPLLLVTHQTARYPRMSTPTWQVLGLQWALDTAAGPPFRPTRVLVLPYWFVMLPPAALPALRLRRAAVRRRRLRLLRRRGRCPACGYDLRATPGRCPECGTAASVTPVA